MEDASPDYQPGIVKDAGFGQSPENPAPPLFLESIALDQDCSVYGSLFVTNNGTFGKDVLIQMNLNVGGAITVTGSISSGGNGNFSGVVAAAGGFASGNPMKLPGASIGGALNKFAGAMDVGGLLKAAGSILAGGEIAGPLMQAVEKLVIGQPPDTGSDTQEPSDVPEAEFYFNKARYTPQEIFDSRSGQFLRVLAITQNSSS
jgi:hypothetical protein